MTEQEWLEATDLRQLLDRLCRGKRRPSDRRLRLFAAGFWRWQAGNLQPEAAERLQRAATLAEQWAESGVRPQGMNDFPGNVVAEKHASAAAKRTAALPLQWGARTRSGERIPPLFRCVFGNPFRPVPQDPAWRTSTVVQLAQAAYDERQLPDGALDPARLAILADTLEEAGCADDAILNHLRGRGPHVRGCWVVDLLLGKS
jgi:hypothetical protein